MLFNPGDLVQIKETGTLAIVGWVHLGSYRLVHRTCESVAWYEKDEIDLVERGHFKKLYTQEEIEAYEKSWDGKVKLF